MVKPEVQVTLLSHFNFKHVNTYSHLDFTKLVRANPKKKERSFFSILSFSQVYKVLIPLASVHQLSYLL